VSGVCYSNLVRIASYLRKLLTFFEIQDGGRRHLRFWIICNFDPTDRFRLVPDVCSWNFVRIASYLRQQSTIFEIQDGGRSHLGFCKYWIFDHTDRFWLVQDVRCWNLVRIGSYLRKLSTSCEIQDDGRRQLGFGKMCIFFNQRIDFCGCRMYAVEIWRELLYICGNYQHFSKFKMAAATILDFWKFAILTLRIDFG
jgi:uncharacterized protein YxjI